MEIRNDILLKTAMGESTERPPVWLMRQAGRILPQYRALRGRLSGFKELVETPELAAEVTLQPIDELDVDAAIIFSDILVIPEAMGLTYEMIEKKGPWFPTTIENGQQIERLVSGAAAAEKLGYVYDALSITKKNLNGRVPLIGFAGAPWTLFCYMVEGSGSKTFSKAKKLLYTEPEQSHKLLQKITDTVIAYLKLKIQNGADLVQVFDSWAGILSREQYLNFALPYLQQICTSIEGTPLTMFAKGAWYAMPELCKLDCETIGLDWTMDPATVRKMAPNKTLQGNLDPCQLYTSGAVLEDATKNMLANFEQGRHIVNLGHGVYPDTPLENVKTFVNTVKAFRY